MSNVEDDDFYGEAVTWTDDVFGDEPERIDHEDFLMLKSGSIYRKLLDTRKMMFPVECHHCYSVYDLAGVETVARYADCTVYKTPCCNRTADDRT
jgi:hypothetical protein